jgi:hypothetical protein
LKKTGDGRTKKQEEEEVGREEEWAVLKVEEMGYQLWFFDSLLRNLLLL